MPTLQKKRPQESRLASYLKDRRSKLDPASFGFTLKRRRTPGLRREEVAQRADVSATWYTWLEQGRGGAPSADVLDRIAHALMLTDIEREHLFLLGLGRLPDARYKATEAISPRIQRLLDAIGHIPAFVKNCTWDVIAWNHAANALFRYAGPGPIERNILRRIFLDPANRALNPHWQSIARFCVSAFRADIIRAGAIDATTDLVNELSLLSPEFKTFWKDHDVRSFGEGTKKLLHPTAGFLELEYSAFAIDARPDLSLVTYNPATPKDAAKIQKLMKYPAKRVRK
jgi:transcriptional regulator with XRE-family HTH domain